MTSAEKTSAAKSVKSGAASAVQASGARRPAARLVSITITCPRCGHRAVEETMTNICPIVHKCRGCGALLRPRPGDRRCVLCSWSDAPLMAEGQSCC